MEIKIIEEKKNKLIFESEDLSHTICNLLEKELHSDSHVKAATYNIAHPLVSVPRMIIETDGKVDPKAALQSAIKRLGKMSDKFKKDFSKEVK